ncbi:ribonuclease P protein component [Dokdonia ponticola]|uniref:Ribonuclease P protein component n=1 Tax=Dokdonia ponticola TaxID=2041041 RepID=A0ABV9HUZ9_9FLAO
MIQEHTFPTKEKLKSKKLIDALFIEGNSVKAFPLRMVFIETVLPYPEITLQAGVSVSKRNHKLAVTRNRIKRLMREAYRTHKHMIDTKGTTFAILIIYTGRGVITYQELERSMVKLLKRFNDAITITHP